MDWKHRLLAVGVVTVTMLADPASGAVLRVPLDHATIGAALAAATAGDEVQVSDAASPYAELLTVPDGVRLIGGWDHPDYTASNPTARPTIVELPADSTGTVIGLGVTGPTTLIQNLTIRGGNTFSGGGIFCGTGSAALITNCILRENRATSGAGIQVAAGSSVRIEDCAFVANRAVARGGGLNVSAGSDDV
ncbi:MAG: right-handed parallel beta-helix repeat-containing protein, partial [bacterium]